VKSYVVELHAADLVAAGERARAAAERLRREGIEVRWIRSVYVPEYETCVVVIEAPTPETVDRIVEGGRPT
jgi:hypothetical protein